MNFITVGFVIHFFFLMWVNKSWPSFLFFVREKKKNRKKKVHSWFPVNYGLLYIFTGNIYIGPAFRRILGRLVENKKCLVHLGNNGLFCLKDMRWALFYILSPIILRNHQFVGPFVMNALWAATDQPYWTSNSNSIKSLVLSSLTFFGINNPKMENAIIHHSISNYLLNH